MDLTNTCGSHFGWPSSNLIPPHLQAFTKKGASGNKYPGEERCQFKLSQPFSKLADSTIDTLEIPCTSLYYNKPGFYDNKNFTNNLFLICSLNTCLIMQNKIFKIKKKFKFKETRVLCDACLGTSLPT